MRWRKRTPSGDAADPSASASLESSGLEDASDPFADGPVDTDVADPEDHPALAGHLDLGGLVVPPPPDDVELRLQVEEATGAVVAALYAGEEGALELRVFAATRNGDLWSEARPELRSEATQHGGTTSERTGPWGTELVCQVPVQLPDGTSGVQPSRVIGVNGPRWLLRATLLGRPALEPDGSADWEDIVRRTVVRRGAGAMPPGEAIPLHLPAQIAEQMADQAADDDRDGNHGGA